MSSLTNTIISLHPPRHQKLRWAPYAGRAIRPSVSVWRQALFALEVDLNNEPVRRADFATTTSLPVFL